MKIVPVNLFREAWMFFPKVQNLFLTRAKEVQKCTEAWMDMFPPWSVIKSSAKSDLQKLPPKTKTVPDFANTVKTELLKRKSRK